MVLAPDVELVQYDFKRAHVHDGSHRPLLVSSSVHVSVISSALHSLLSHSLHAYVLVVPPHDPVRYWPTGHEDACFWYPRTM